MSAKNCIDFGYLVPDYMSNPEWKKLSVDDNSGNPSISIEALIAKKQETVFDAISVRYDMTQLLNMVDSDNTPEEVKDIVAWLVVHQLYLRKKVGIPPSLQAKFDEINGLPGRKGWLEKIQDGSRKLPLDPRQVPAVEVASASNVIGANKTADDMSLSLAKIKTQFPGRINFGTFPTAGED